MHYEFDWKKYYYDPQWMFILDCFDTVMPKEESEEDKLEKKFEELKKFLHEEGFITIGRLCRVMDFECDNPYEFYCGDKDKWQKAVIDILHEHRDDPEVTKQLIEVLHEQYKDGEDE